MKKFTIYTALYLGLIIYGNSLANIINVPGDVQTIQGAINLAAEGDTVLVAQGRYFENINFKGKNILVTSHFLTSGSREDIYNTIIDGSQPVHPDTTSCVLIVNGETRDAVLQGFYITRGKGTKWEDEHGAGIYVEGGGILMTLSSPTIKYNVITNNEAVRSGNEIISAGGGAIRCGDGSPLIVNNIIQNNKGLYGGGIVMNYAWVVIKNNIIKNNQVIFRVSTPTFGGGGIWIYSEGPVIVENNTIIGNSSLGFGDSPAGKGGGLMPVNLVIYDVSGREVATLVNERQRPGDYEVKWDASGMTSGIYFYRLQAGSFAQVKKLILLK